MSAVIARFENVKHEDLFRMGGKALRAEASGRNARATAAKAELARRDANAIAKGKKPAAKAKPAAKPAAKKPAGKPAAGGGGQVARSRAKAATPAV